MWGVATLSSRRRECSERGVHEMRIPERLRSSQAFRVTCRRKQAATREKAEARITMGGDPDENERCPLLGGLVSIQACGLTQRAGRRSSTVNLW